MKINLTKSTIFFFLFIFNDLLADNNYFAQGIDLFQSKKFDNAKIKFEQDIVFNPKNEMSYLYLAKIFQKKDEIKQEKKNLNTVLLLNPENEEAVYFLAILNIKESNFKRSEELIENLGKVCKEFCSKKAELTEKLNNLLKQ